MQQNMYDVVVFNTNFFVIVSTLYNVMQVRSGISSNFSGISGYKYKVNKFKIVESKDIKNGTPVRDYFLKVLSS